MCGKGANHGSKEHYCSRNEDLWFSSIAIREDAEGDQKFDTHCAPHGIYQVHLEDGGSEVEGKEYGNRVTHRA